MEDDPDRRRRRRRLVARVAAGAAAAAATAAAAAYALPLAGAARALLADLRPAAELHQEAVNLPPEVARQLEEYLRGAGGRAAPPAGLGPHEYAAAVALRGTVARHAAFAPVGESLIEYALGVPLRGPGRHRGELRELVGVRRPV